MGSISAAFSSFFGILFSNDIPAGVAASLGWVKRTSVVAAGPAAAAAPVKKEPVVGPADGALQLLGILQRDARLVDFLMENLSAYSDEQIGAAVRNVQEQSRQALDRYVKLDPVIDGVEGTYVKAGSGDANLVKLTGKVPADGKAAGGTLRHKGWRAVKVNLPPVFPHQKTDVVAPAELEIE